MANLIVPPNWVNSTDFKMSPWQFKILGKLEQVVWAIESGKCDCGYSIGERKWSICVANGRCNSIWSYLLHCMFMFYFPFWPTSISTSSSQSPQTWKIDITPAAGFSQQRQHKLTRQTSKRISRLQLDLWQISLKNIKFNF